MQFIQDYWKWCLVGLLAFNLFVFGFSELLVVRTTRRVIDSLQKDYSPSPYSPGFDPDRVSPKAFKNPPTEEFEEESGLQDPIPGEVAEQRVVPWEEEWEENRASPVRSPGRF